MILNWFLFEHLWPQISIKLERATNPKTNGAVGDDGYDDPDADAGGDYDNDDDDYDDAVMMMM